MNPGSGRLASAGQALCGSVILSAGLLSARQGFTFDGTSAVCIGASLQLAGLFLLLDRVVPEDWLR